MSTMLVTRKPKLFNALTEDSLPGPGPFIRTSMFFIPYSFATWPARSAATCAAKGVLFLEPLNPDPPAVAHDRPLPCLSVIVMMVLLKDACTCAMPSTTVLFAFFLVFGLAIVSLYLKSHCFIQWIDMLFSINA